MRTIIPTTVELGDGPQDITASWHSTPANVYGEPPAETVTVNVLASGIEIGVYAGDAAAGLDEVADHLELVAARVRELVQNLERDAQVGYQRTAHELEGDMRGHARTFTAAERNAHLQHERELDVVARSLGVGYGNAKPTTQQDRECFCGELARVDRPCSVCERAKLHKALDENEVGRVRGPEHVPVDLFGDLMK